MEYRWSCTACGNENEKGEERCSRCLCPAECNAMMAEAHLRVLKQSLCEDGIVCERCASSNLEAVYPQSYEEYKYINASIPYRARFILFRVFFFLLRCQECKHSKNIEVEVPLLRKIYRAVFNKDIERKWLKNI